MTTTTATTTTPAVSLPITTPEDRVRFGSVGSVEYRDTIAGVRHTVHYERGRSGHGWWITRHGQHTGDSDGPAVARSPYMTWPDVAAAWEEVRHSG